MTVTPRRLTPLDVRLACRSGQWDAASTAGVCAGFVQANLVVLPSKYAADFRALCARNPVPCPLLGETVAPGNPSLPPHLAKDCDVRTDAPAYNVYVGGKLVGTKSDIVDEWQADSVCFLIGCSFSFEAALAAGGLTPRQIEISKNVPMCASSLSRTLSRLDADLEPPQTKRASRSPPQEVRLLLLLLLEPSQRSAHSLLLVLAHAVFSGRMVVSMRPYLPSQVELARDLTRPFVRAHGEPVAWGAEGAASLGIDDPLGERPDFGEASEVREGEVPVYWVRALPPPPSPSSRRRN